MGRGSQFPSPPASRLSGPLGRRIVPVLAVALVAAPGVVLRLWNLNALGFNSDEAVYAGQAAAIAGNPQLSTLFPVFRAHPLLFQMAVSLMYRVQVSDLTPRLLAVAFGLATVAVGYAAGTVSMGAGPGWSLPCCSRRCPTWSW